jgi:hypothetical protein
MGVTTLPPRPRPPLACAARPPRRESSSTLARCALASLLLASPPPPPPPRSVRHTLRLLRLYTRTRRVTGVAPRLCLERITTVSRGLGARAPLPRACARASCRTRGARLGWRAANRWAGLALFTLFSPELGLWLGTFHVTLQSKHQLMTASMLHQSVTRE